MGYSPWGHKESDMPERLSHSQETVEDLGGSIPCAATETSPATAKGPAAAAEGPERCHEDQSPAAKTPCSQTRLFFFLIDLEMTLNPSLTELE